MFGPHGSVSKDRAPPKDGLRFKLSFKFKFQHTKSKKYIFIINNNLWEQQQLEVNISLKFFCFLIFFNIDFVNPRVIK